MKQTVSHSEATRLIWEVYDHQFTYAGANELASYYENLEEEIGEDIEIDPVAIACDWDEYGDAEELVEAYGYVLNDDWAEEEDSEKVDAVIEYLRENTDVIEFSGGWLVSAF